MAHGLLQELFGEGVETEEVDSSAQGVSELLPAESAAVGRARDRRLLEFRAGRHCARLALARLGLPNVPVPQGSDRAPVWPEGIVGSISHTSRSGLFWCGAAVAHAEKARSLGLDAEIDEPLEQRLYSRVLTRQERSRLGDEPAELRGFLAKLVFSAKECVYKAQYPLSKAFLEFADVEVVIGQGTFVGRMVRDAPPFGQGDQIGGRWVRAGGVIVTAIRLS